MASPAVQRDDDRTLVLTRTFDAPRETVFQAWTDPAQIARWIGPPNVKSEVTKMEPHVGGGYRFAMHMNSGNPMCVRGVYRELTPPERLVFTWAWEDAADPQRTGPETTVTVTLRAVGAKTELTLHHALFDSKENRDNHGKGWSGTLDKLVDYLATGHGSA